MTANGRVKQALVCAPLLPEFDREGGSRRIFNLLEFLREAGWGVSYVAENPHGDDRYVRMLQQRGIAVYRGFDSRTKQLLRLGHFDVAIFAFWYLAENHLRSLRRSSPHTKILIDVIDLHWLRHARQYFLRPSGNSAASRNSNFASEMVRELKVYSQADALLTVSDKEADTIRDVLGNRPPAFTVPDMEESIPSPVPFEDRRGILFVGNFKHPPNADGVIFFCEDVLPRMDRKLLETHPLVIVGNQPPAKILSYARASPFVRVVGWAPSVVPYLQSARVTIVPMRYGAGTKRKLVQGLMAHTPTVTTSMGLEGLDVVPDEHVLLADDAPSFAAATERLLRDRKLWTKLADQGSERVLKLHGRDAARTRLLAALEAVSIQPSSRRSRAIATRAARDRARAGSGAKAPSPRAQRTKPK